VVDVPPGATETVAARYACADGTAFTARFDRFGEGAVLTFERFDRDDPDGPPQDKEFRIVLGSQRPASGIWYAGSGWSLRGKGEVATLTRPDGRTSGCRAGDAAPGAPPAADI